MGTGDFPLLAPAPVAGGRKKPGFTIEFPVCLVE